MKNLLYECDIDPIMKQAWAMSKQSQCLKKKVGAVLVNTISLEIVGYGYGGAKHTCKKCLKKEVEWSQDGCWAVHSELRALFNFFSNQGFQKSLSNCFMVVTHGPCDQCLKYMDYFGIPFVIYDKEYHNDYSKWYGKIEVFNLEKFKKLK